MGSRFFRHYSGPLTFLLRLVPPRSLAALALAVIAAAMTEGVGIFMIAPFLSTVDGGDAPRWLRTALEISGLPATPGPLLTLLVGLVILRAAIVHSQRLIGLKVQQTVVDSLRREAFSSIICANWRWLTQTRSSDYFNTIVMTVARVGFGLQQALSTAAALVILSAYFAVSALTSWRVTFLVLALAGLMIWPLRHWRERALRQGERFGERQRSLANFVKEELAGIRLSKIHCIEQKRIEALDDIMAAARRERMEYDVRDSSLQNVMQVGGAVLLALILFVGLAIWHMPLATMAPFGFVIARAVPMLNGLHRSWSEWLIMSPAVEEIREVISACRAAGEHGHQSDSSPVRFREAIVLDGATVQYTGRSTAAINNISLRIKARTVCTISGPSGAGKSTLADVLMGLTELDRGRMSVDGVPLQGEARMGWRKSVAYVQQDPFLFHDTIRRNLTLERPDVDDDAIRTALTSASAMFVYNLPDGLETIVGDGGVRLSGGERQRIALARELIGAPDLLILDEPTSAIDPRNERFVWDAMHALRHQMTIVAIIHRDGMVADVDQFIRLDGGLLVRGDAAEHAEATPPDPAFLQGGTRT